MKLRNKKTEEIVDVYNIYISKRVEDDSLTSHENVIRSFDSIAELNEELEDYKPTVPLIKDEKIRKAVRAFWEAIPDVVPDKRILYKKNQDLAVGIYSIYCGAIYPETLEVGKMYTITELCGEVEE